MSRIAALFIGLALSAPASAGLLSPSTYSECILQNMKGVGSDVAARAIAAACAKRFPPPKKAVTKTQAPAEPVRRVPHQARPGDDFSSLNGFIPDRPK